MEAVTQGVAPRSVIRYQPVHRDAVEPGVAPGFRRASALTQTGRQRTQTPVRGKAGDLTADVRELDTVHTDAWDAHLCPDGDEQESSGIRRPVPERSRRTTAGCGEPLHAGQGARTTTQSQAILRSRGLLYRARVRQALILLSVLLVVWGLWSSVWVIRLGIFRLDNHIRFDTHAPSDAISLVLAGDTDTHRTKIIVVNIDGQVIVTIIPGNDLTHGQQLAATTLRPSVWGDVDQVVPSLSVQPGGIIQLTLNGDPQYRHFLAFPLQETFELLPEAQDGLFQIVQIA